MALLVRNRDHLHVHAGLDARAFPSRKVLPGGDIQMNELLTVVDALRSMVDRGHLREVPELVLTFRDPGSAHMMRRVLIEQQRSLRQPPDHRFIVGGVRIRIKIEQEVEI
jgi:hypothetical protein